MFQLLEPLAVGGAGMTVKLHSASNHRGLLKRFRLSVTDDDRAIEFEQLRHRSRGDAALLLATAYFFDDQQQKAIDLLQSDRVSDEGVRLLLLAKSWGRLGRSPEAKQACEQLVSWLEKYELDRSLCYQTTNALVEFGGFDREQASWLAVQKAVRRQIAAQLATLTEATKKTPDPKRPARAYYNRGVFFSRLGRWQESRDDFLKAIELKREQRTLWVWAVPLFLFADDERGYRRHCREMAEQFQDAKEPLYLTSICKAPLLLPTGFDLSKLPLDALQNATENAKDDTVGDWLRATSALLAYRKSDFQAAANWAQQVTPRVDGADLLAALVRAMAEHRLGRGGR